MFVIALAAIACDHQQIENAGFDLNYSMRSIDVAQNGLVVAAGSTNSGEDGHVVVSTRISSQWNQIHLSGDSAFGAALSMAENGTMLAVGSPQKDFGTNLDTKYNKGIVDVHTLSHSTYTTVSHVDERNRNSNTELGRALKLSTDGNTLVIGMNHRNGSVYTYQIRVYDWDDSATWVERNSSIEGTHTVDNNGETHIVLDINDDASIIAVGYPFAEDGDGLVQVYEWKNNQWGKRGREIIPMETLNFGSSLALSHNGSLLVIGSHENSNAYVEILKWNISEWIVLWYLLPQNLDICGPPSIALADDTLALGCPEAVVNGKQGAGIVHIYDRSGNEWINRNNSIKGSVQNQELGKFVSLSRDGFTLALNSDTTKVAVYDLCSSAPPAPPPKSQNPETSAASLHASHLFVLCIWVFFIHHYF